MSGFRDLTSDRVVYLPGLSGPSAYDDAKALDSMLADAVARLPEGISQVSDEVLATTEARFKMLGDALRIAVANEEPGHIKFDEDGTGSTWFAPEADAAAWFDEELFTSAGGPTAYTASLSETVSLSEALVVSALHRLMLALHVRLTRAEHLVLPADPFTRALVFLALSLFGLCCERLGAGLLGFDLRVGPAAHATSRGGTHPRALALRLVQFARSCRLSEQLTSSRFGADGAELVGDGRHAVVTSGAR